MSTTMKNRRGNQGVRSEAGQRASYNPALFSAHRCHPSRRHRHQAKTAFEAYKEQSDEFTIDHVAEVHG